jgi:hypothetical protein
VNHGIPFSGTRERRNLTEADWWGQGGAYAVVFARDDAKWESKLSSWEPRNSLF